MREPGGGGKTAGALPQSPDVVQPSRSIYSCLNLYYSHVLMPSHVQCMCIWHRYVGRR